MAEVWLEYEVESGLVVNAVEWDGATPYEPPEGLALVKREDSEAWIGWIYDGRKFSRPEPEPEPAAAEGDLAAALAAELAKLGH